LWQSILELGLSARILGKQNIFNFLVDGGCQRKRKNGKNELVRLPYRFKLQKSFGKPCAEWLELIGKMCTEILGNYKKKEGQLMTAAFGTREKRRLNRVMDTLGFEYPDYERLDDEARGLKRKGL
jgi:hypothetical protein